MSPVGRRRPRAPHAAAPVAVHAARPEALRDCEWWRAEPRDESAQQVARVVIAAGGTAGHVVPAIAVADALRAEGSEVSFVGGERAEAELVPAAGYPLDRIAAEGISRSNPLKAARALLKA